MATNALGRVISRLDERNCRPRQTGSNPPKYQSQCPAHEDRRPSLSVSQGDKGALLFCHAGCSTDAVCAELGLSTKDLADGPQGDGGMDIQEVYGYRDTVGNLLYEVVRLRPKGFRQRRPNGKWGIQGVERVPYRLDRIAVNRPEVLYVAEGEKDVHALEAAGAIATCNPGGAGKWRDQYTKVIVDAYKTAGVKPPRIIIFPDNDGPGRQHADAVARSFRKVAPQCDVQLGLLWDPERDAAGLDATDWLAAGNRLENLRTKLAAASPPPSPAPQPPPRRDRRRELSIEEQEERLRERVGITVSGSVDGMTGLYNTRRLRPVLLPDLPDLKYEHCLKHLGMQFQSAVARSSQEQRRQSYTFREFVDVLGVLLAERQHSESQRAGAGVWPLEQEDGLPCGRYLLVQREESAVVDAHRGAVEVVVRPVVGPYFPDPSTQVDWFDCDRLRERLAAAAEPQEQSRVAHEIVRLFENWRWSTSDAPKLLVGAIICGVLQKLVRIKPSIRIIGPAGSGKSETLRTIRALLANRNVNNGLADYSGQSSAAGILYADPHGARLLLQDERDSLDRRQQTKTDELMRMAYSGDTVRKGTANKQSQEHALGHMMFLAGIYDQANKNQDLQRAVLLELTRPGQWAQETPLEELREKGQALIAAALRIAPHFSGRIKAAMRHAGDEFPARVAMNYATCAAGWSLLTGMTDEETGEWVAELARDALDREGLTDEGHEESQGLLDRILSARVELERSDEHGRTHKSNRWVSEVLRGEDEAVLYQKDLERKGVKLCDDNRGSGIAIQPNKLTEPGGILRASEPEKNGRSVGQMLMRLDKEVYAPRRAIVRFVGQRKRAIVINREGTLGAPVAEASPPPGDALPF